MSRLLDAIAGVANAAEPIPGLVTGGQPQPAQLAQLKAAGCAVAIDARDPMETRPYAVPDGVVAAGLEFVALPISAATQNDATLTATREALRAVVGRRPAFFYCNSGNRVGAAMIPYLMLDRGMTEEEAVTLAMRMGMRSAGLMEWALDYVRRHGPGRSA